MKLKIDSRKVEKGDIFLAIKGNNNDGHKFVVDAINNGASKVIVEGGEYDVETIKVSNTTEYLEKYLKDNYYNKIKHIKLIGMTGTNGKTTTCYLIYQALNKLNIRCAYIGTLGFFLPNKKIDTTNTTPNLYELYNMLITCKENNIEYVVMEVSSQGLDMGRVNTLKFDYVIFSNLTQDHLDYHKTMDNYLNCKLKLFKMLKSNGVALVNSDDKYSSYFMFNKNTITYGSSGNYKISNIISTLDGTSFKLNNKLFNTKLIGDYNIYNLSIVIIILKLLNIENINSIISDLAAPPGRMEIIKYNTNNIIIDYAHTPDAVYKIINEVSKIKHNRIITIIGCGGNRDKTKRPIMGNISTSLSDFCIFTTDNPRYENKVKILNDIVCKLDNKNYKIIKSRKKAIKIGIHMLKKNDILLLLGKGHEDYQIIKDKKIHFSDQEIVKSYIRR